MEQSCSKRQYIIRKGNMEYHNCSWRYSQKAITSRQQNREYRYDHPREPKTRLCDAFLTLIIQGCCRFKGKTSPMLPPILSPTYLYAWERLNSLPRNCHSHCVKFCSHIRMYFQTAKRIRSQKISMQEQFFQSCHCKYDLELSVLDKYEIIGKTGFELFA